LPITITGETARQTNASYQQNTNPMIMPPKSAHIPSKIGPRDSVETPLTIWVSSAIALVKTLVPFSFSSNHPMFFLRIF